MNYEIYRVAWVSDRYLEDIRKYNEQFNINTWNTSEHKLKKPELPEEITRTEHRCNPIKTTKIEGFISFEWDDDKDKISTSFVYNTSEELNCGDWICLHNAKDDVDVLYGVITNKSYSDLYKYTYTGRDVGFYFENNDLTIQFQQEETVTNAIKKVCDRIKVASGHITQFKHSAKGIHRNKKAVDVLKDLNKKLFEKFTTKDKDGNEETIFGYSDIHYFDCKNGKLNFNRFAESSEELKGYIDYLAKHEFFDYINDFTISSSMEDLKNRVQLFVKDSPNNKDALPDFTNSAKDSISKYGLLNHIEEVDKQKEYNDYNLISKDLLNSLNKETETIKFSIRGDYNLRRGMIVPIYNDKLKLYSSYDVLSSKHIIDATSELVEVTIRKNNSKNKI